jgi:hypothetical protein
MMKDLRALPAVELAAVLECAGNGRAFFEPSVPGIQWENGAVGNGRWRGVRLADVLKRAGVRSSAKEVVFDGADVPLGSMPDFQRSIPIAKALDPNTLLAYEMNGQALPTKHGFPLRVISAGWASDSWVKWLTSIRVLDREFDGFWMKSAYRYPGKGVAPGSTVPSEQMQPVTSLRVKSVISSPIDGSQVVAGKPVFIRGVAWSGDRGPVAAVDVSVDSGRTWGAAQVNSGQNTQFGWRQWEFMWTPRQEAEYTIMAKARDTVGNVQPLEQEWNPSGYLWNVAPRLRVRVVKQVSGQLAPQPDAARNVVVPSRFRNSCVVCHDEDVIRQQRLTRVQWDRELTKMTNWGAKIQDEDRGVLLDSLVNRFGPRPR